MRALPGTRAIAPTRSRLRGTHAGSRAPHNRVTVIDITISEDVECGRQYIVVLAELRPPTDPRGNRAGARSWGRPRVEPLTAPKGWSAGAQIGVGSSFVPDGATDVIWAGSEPPSGVLNRVGPGKRLSLGSANNGAR